MPGKHFKAVEKLLLDLGYEPDHQNANSCWVYVHPDHEDVPVGTGLTEQQARSLTKRLRRLHGIEESKPHRNAAAVKERQAREREALRQRADRLEAERAALVARKLDLLPYELTRQLARIDAERREVELLMAAPVGGKNLGSGRARHEAGQSSPRGVLA